MSSTEEGQKVRWNRKDFYDTEKGKVALKRMKEWHASEKGKEHRKVLVGLVSGKNNHRYQAFELIETTIEGKVNVYTFDCPKSPMAQCKEEFGINLNVICALKKGESWEIKVVPKKSRHPFSKGSVITLNKIDPK